MLFYATSNRRHLMPRDMMENERSTAINPSEAVEEKVSLSDRFGLWLGFHNCGQDEYLAMIDGYAAHYRSEARAERSCTAARWPGRRDAARARAAWPGSSSRIWAANSARRSASVRGHQQRARIDRLHAVADLEMQLRLETSPVLPA